MRGGGCGGGDGGFDLGEGLHVHLVEAHAGALVRPRLHAGFEARVFHEVGRVFAVGAGELDGDVGDPDLGGLLVLEIKRETGVLGDGLGGAEGQAVALPGGGDVHVGL